MPRLVDVMVILTLHDPIAFRGDHRVHFLLNGLRHNRVGVVAFVGQQMLSGYPLNQCSRLGAIRRGTVCNNNSERHTMRIHGQMYLAVEPPFVSPMASLPPRAPAA